MSKSKGGIRDYIVKVLNGMALGLFASLLIGLIIKQIGTLLNISLLINFGNIAQRLMGPAIGAGVAYSVGAPHLQWISMIFPVRMFALAMLLFGFG